MSNRRAVTDVEQTFDISSLPPRSNTPGLTRRDIAGIAVAAVFAGPAAFATLGVNPFADYGHLPPGSQTVKYDQLVKEQAKANQDAAKGASATVQTSKTGLSGASPKSSVTQDKPVARDGLHRPPVAAGQKVVSL